MSRPASELEAALRAVTHDVRASLGVILSALDEVEHETSGRAVLDGRVRDLLGMMRRSARRLEILADATEIVRQDGDAAPLPARIDLAQLAQDALASRMPVERAEPIAADMSLPPTAFAAVVVPWCRYIFGEAIAFAARRARQRLAIALASAADDEAVWILSVSSDAPARPGAIGAPFTHPLGLAASLARNLRGDVEVVEGETVHVRVRIPKGQ
jgi:signal transduction histidine kinase